MKRERYPSVYRRSRIDSRHEHARDMLNVYSRLSHSTNTEHFCFLLQICTTIEELKQFMQNTLLFVQSDSKSVDIDEQLEMSLQSLQKLGHVTIAQSRKIEVTHLGQATFKGENRKSNKTQNSNK